jgi:hypothetical protein
MLHKGPPRHFILRGVRLSSMLVVPPEKLPARLDRRGTLPLQEGRRSRLHLALTVPLS